MKDLYNFFTTASIRKKLLILLSAASLTLLILLIVLGRILILGSFGDLEEQVMKKNVERVLGEISNEFMRIGSFCYDYAVWDDTYFYIDQPDETHIKRNFDPDTFKNIDVNFYVIFNNKGQVVYSTNYFPSMKSLLPISDFFLSKLKRHDALKKPGPKGKFAFLSYKQAPVMIVSKQVLHSDRSGPVNGMEPPI